MFWPHGDPAEPTRAAGSGQCPAPRYGRGSPAVLKCQEPHARAQLFLSVTHPRLRAARRRSEPPRPGSRLRGRLSPAQPKPVLPGHRGARAGKRRPTAVSPLRGRRAPGPRQPRPPRRKWRPRPSAPSASSTPRPDRLLPADPLPPGPSGDGAAASPCPCPGADGPARGLPPPSSPAAAAAAAAQGPRAPPGAAPRAGSVRPAPTAVTRQRLLAAAGRGRSPRPPRCPPRGVTVAPAPPPPRGPHVTAAAAKVPRRGPAQGTVAGRALPSPLHLRPPRSVPEGTGSQRSVPGSELTSDHGP